MRLKMADKRSIIRGYAEMYRRGRKRERSGILDQIEEVTGYHRKYAAWLLRNHGRRVKIGRKLVVIGDVRKRGSRNRKRKYDDEVKRVVVELWRLCDYVTGKRLVPAIREMVPILEEKGEIKLSDEVRKKVMEISPATVDRLLRDERKKYSIKRRICLTKPGTLLKRQIPIRTFSQWDDTRPGYMEVDLVSHDGGNPEGEFCYTLDMVDVSTGWSEQIAVLNRAQVWVFEGIKEVRQRLPFDMKGLDSDNGSEFINHQLKRYCEREGIEFTRSRPYQKNDTCHVEQKNWSIVRRFVGYGRYTGEKQRDKLNQLYKLLRLYVNLFLPSMRLKEKTRDGARVIRRYDDPMTPYKRIMNSEYISEEQKEKLRHLYHSINPAELHRQIEQLQIELIDIASKNSRREKYENKSKLRKSNTNYDSIINNINKSAIIIKNNINNKFKNKLTIGEEFNMSQRLLTGKDFYMIQQAWF